MKVLFVVNGLGLGNSTRCLSIIRYLKTLGHECDVLSSGMARTFYEQNRSEVDQLHFQEGLGYSNEGSKGLSIWGFFKKAPRNAVGFFSNVKTQYRLLKQKQYDLVVSDSDYSVFFLRFFLNFKFAAINNSLHSIENLRLLSKSEKLKVFFHLSVEMIDYFLHRWCTHLTICPTLDFRPVQTIGCFKIVSPICRQTQTIPTGDSAGPLKLLVMISGCKTFDQTKLKDKISGLKGIEKRALYPDENQKLSSNIQDLLWCDVIITNAGFSSLSESVEFCRPAIVMPLEFHSEQLINAKIYAENNFGIHSNPSDCEQDLVRLMKNIDMYKNSLSANKKDFRGDVQAGNLLIELMDQKNAYLRR